MAESGWNPDACSREFLAKALSADRSLQELSVKARSNKHYELHYDMALAEFYVFNYLHGKTFLESYESFIEELKSMRDDLSAIPPDAYDHSRYAQFRRNVIDNLIKRFESVTPK